MTRIPSLPRHRGGAWPGGIVFDSPVYTASISASGGTVLAATERVYRFAPGAARWQWGETPEGYGDVTCVAVEPRLPGRPRCTVAATIGALHFFDDEGVTTQELPEGYGDAEVHEMMWAPRAGGLDPTMCLYLHFGDSVLRLLPHDGGPTRHFEGKFWPTDRPEDEPVAFAGDGDRGVAFAVFDEERWDLDVWALIDFETYLWGRRSVPAPSFFSGARLAVAGTAVAVAFDHVGGVWLTRNLKDQDLVELEPFRGAEGAEFDRGAVVAFEGASAEAGLFVAAQETARRSIIARVDATGSAERIAELEVGEESVVRLIQQMAWDDTRRTLWCAAGRAGVLGSSAPESPVPIGKGAVVRATS